MSKIIKISASVMTGYIAVMLFSSHAFAESDWEKNHLRRNEVNSRLHHQDQRITHERQNGQISQQQAKQLHQQDHQIGQEERDMASQNGGHLTKQEDQTLNSQENAVSKEIAG